jgi:hypothetical protein
MVVGVCRKHCFQQFLRGMSAQMVFVLASFSGPVSAAKHDTVPFIEGHLRCAASVVVWIVGNILIVQPYVTNLRLTPDNVQGGFGGPVIKFHAAVAA